LTTRSLAALSPLPRFGHRASSSSKNITHGADAQAQLNNYQTALSLSPTYLFRSSGPLIDIKLALLSLLTALATSVLPHPGGPNNKTPAGAVRPTSLYFSGYQIGSTTLVNNSSQISFKAPTSSQVIFGIVVNPSL